VAISFESRARRPLPSPAYSNNNLVDLKNAVIMGIEARTELPNGSWSSQDVRPRGRTGALAANFMRGQKTREEITDLMEGGEALANLDAGIEAYEQSHGGHPPSPAG
jgi:hypothetical protein